MENLKNDTFELGEKNILEEFYELIEKHRLDPENDFKLGDFYDILSEFDQEYQKFNIANNHISNEIVNKYLMHGLYVFLILFKFRGFTDRPVFHAFKRFVYWFTFVLKNSNGIKSDFFFRKNISENFPSLWYSKFIIELKKKPINLNLYKPKHYEYLFNGIENIELEIAEDFGFNGYDQNSFKTNFLIFGDSFSVKEIQVNEDGKKIKTIGESYEMTLDITISDEEKDGAKLISILNLLLSSISNIHNVKLEIEEIKIGSLISRIRIYLKDLEAKEETKAVLETTKEAVIRALSGGQVSHMEIKKMSAETKKLNSEQRLLEKDLENRPSDFETKMSNTLDLEKKALENEKLRIQNTKEKLEVIDKLSALATKGVLEADMIKIDINEILYLLIDKGKLNSPRIDIDQIT